MAGWLMVPKAEREAMLCRLASLEGQQNMARCKRDQLAQAEQQLAMVRKALTGPKDMETSLDDIKGLLQRPVDGKASAESI